MPERTLQVDKTNDVGKRSR